MTITTISFDDTDAYLGNAIETGIDFSTNALVPGVPQNYEAYLNRSEIFDDVKDVLQTFDILLFQPLQTSLTVHCVNHL